MRGGAIHVEIATTASVLARTPGEPSSWLSDTERVRWAGLRIDARRHQYCAGHWLARELVARMDGGDATAFELVECPSRPPRVAGHDDLRVSISHSGEWIAVAVARCAIGIDLEQRPRALSPAIAALLLDPGQAPASVDADGLLLRWVAKEAWIKRGEGSALPAQLQQIRLESSPSQHADVRMVRAEAFHFALAAPPEVPVQRRSEAALTDTAGFKVFEAT